MNYGPNINSFSVDTPETLIFGRGRASTVGEHASRFGDRALVITDENLHTSGVVDPVLESLRDTAVEFSVFDRVEPEPTLSIVTDAVDAAATDGTAVLIGVGGGSTLDVTKAAASMLKNPDIVVDPFGRNHLDSSGVPTILLPTTAGTGSEVSPAVVLVDDRSDPHEKKGMVDRALYADVSIVDPALTDRLPPELTAATGLDAYSHAIGSLISTRSNPLADAICLEALALIEQHLRTATFRGSDAPRARDGMALGATMAMLGRVQGGKAAIHAVAYGVQSVYDVPHATAIAIVLPSVLEYNRPACVPALSRLGTRLYDATGSPQNRATAVIDGIRQLRADVDMDRSLTTVGATEADLDEMARMSVRSTRHLEANPRSMTAADARTILAELL